MPKRPPSREYRIYLALWRKAYAERDLNLPPVSVTCSSKSIAISMRQGMYRAISPYRIGVDFDEELRKAADNFVASLVEEPGEKPKIVFKPRVTLSELEREIEALGLSESDLLLSDEKTANLKLEEFLGLGDQMPKVERPSNPFYERD